MDTGQLPILDLDGTPRERGRAHGEAMRAQIRDVREKYLDYVSDYFGIDPASFFDGFARHADYRGAIERHAPHLLEEVWGLAEGAGLEPGTALSMQLVDEEWQYGFFHHLPATPRNKCSSFGVVTPQITYAGQNMDIPHMFDGHQILMRVRDPAEDRVAYVFAYAGMIGLNGMNDARIGLCCNALNQMTPSRSGLPVAFIVRLLLEQKCFAGALGVLESVPHASGQNYLLAGPGRVGSFECSSTRLVECPGGEHGRVCHTNHALANEDVGAFHDRVADLPPDERPTFHNSRQRLVSIAGRVEKMETVTLDTLKAALSAHDDPHNPVSRTQYDIDGSPIGFTAGSMIYALGEVPTLHITAGPPCSTPWRSIEVR